MRGCASGFSALRVCGVWPALETGDAMSAQLTCERRLGVVSVVAATAVALSLLLVSSAGADPVGDQFRISNQGPDGQAFTAELADIAYNPRTGQSLVVWLGSEAAAPETTFEIG